MKTIPNANSPCQKMGRAIFAGWATSLLAVIFATSAFGQITVSNLSNPVFGSALSIIQQTVMAAQFTIDSSNYTLNSVQLRLALSDGSSPLIVQIQDESAGIPGQVLETLTLNGPSITTESNYEFVSSGISLAPSTNYFVTATVQNGTYGAYHWSVTEGTTETNTGSATWTFADITTTSGNAGIEWYTYPYILMYSVTATAVPEPSTYAVFASLTVLGLAVWRRRRST